MSADKDKSIRERAYELWENEGRPEGRSEQHWEQARAEIADVQKSTRAPAKKGSAGGKSRAAEVSGKAASSASGKKGASGENPGKPRAKRATAGAVKKKAPTPASKKKP